MIKKQNNIIKNTKRKKGESTAIISLKGRHFFLTVPHFLQSIEDIVSALKANQPEWDYIQYAMVWETHTQDYNKSQHLHLYICYPRVLRVRVDRFDYLGKHGKLEQVRGYASILRYMCKQNRPVANFDYIEVIMKRDFTRAVDILVSQGLHIRQIYRRYRSIVASKNWSGYLKFAVYMHESEKFLKQLNRPGLQMITTELITARLTVQQLGWYQSNPLFGRIVDLINDIIRYGCNRPHKAKALLISGEPGTGKTTLGLALAQHVGTFTFPDDGWWQGYQSNTFKLIIWNQFSLRRFEYPTLLKFLEGLRMDLPIKGSHVTRSDNPLIYLTSNLTLEQHICRRYSNLQDRSFSRANLGARIQHIEIGSTPLFVLLKLLVSPT